MDFEFATAAQIVFGPGRSKGLAQFAVQYGRRALIVTGRGKERAQLVADLLAPEKIVTESFHVPGEPSVEDVRQGVRLAREHGCELVIGVGGGSALDAAKGIAALLTNQGDLFDYLEVVGRGQPLTRPSAPCIALPTTAGTGAEVTRNAVLAAPEHGFKVSLRSPFMLPRLALVDPGLCLGLPPELTATTGLDALTQLIEPFVSHRANPLTDGFCLEGLQRVARSLQLACEHGNDLTARTDMSLASLLSGLALANAGLGAVHGFAAPLGGIYGAPHGAICAALLPHVMQVNISALEQRQPHAEPLRRFSRIAQVLTGHPSATAAAGLSWIQQLSAKLNVRPLGALGVRRQDFAELVAKAAKASSMKANPIPLLPEELHEILERAF